MSVNKAPFGCCIYDQDIADSVRNGMCARQIADKHIIDTAVIRARAKHLGIELNRTGRGAWHTRALDLANQGWTYQDIATKLGRSQTSVRACLVSAGMITTAPTVRKPPKAAEVVIGKNQEKTLLDLPSKMPWPDSVLRLPIKTPKELLVPCRLVQNGKIVRRFSDMIGAFRAQKSLPGESQVVRKSDGKVLKNKIIKTPKYPTWAK